MQIYHSFLQPTNFITSISSQTYNVQLIPQSNLTPQQIKISIFNNQLIFIVQDANYILKNQVKCKPQYFQQKLQSIIIQIFNHKVIINSLNKNQLHQIFTILSLTHSQIGFSQYFQVCKKLGKGTFATVYLVQNKITKQKKAVKVFSKQGHKLQYRGQQSLQNQIKILRILNNKNIIKFEGVFETQGLIYLVTQYLSGGTLEETLKNKFKHSGQLTIKILKDILEALKYLKKQNIMHRDIKPQNIMLRQSDGNWVITDFGLATFIDQDYLSYGKCGTLGYIAPQVINQQNIVDNSYNQSCDIYSFGVIAYTLIVGTLPFRVQVENIFDKKIIWQFFQKEQCKIIPTQVINFLKGLLQKAPKLRLKPQQALNLQIFNDKAIFDQLCTYHSIKNKQRFKKILRIANS